MSNSRKKSVRSTRALRVRIAERIASRRTLRNGIIIAIITGIFGLTSTLIIVFCKPTISPAFTPTPKPTIASTPTLDCFLVILDLNVTEINAEVIVQVDGKTVFKGAAINGTVNICVPYSYDGTKVDFKVSVDGYQPYQKDLFVEPNMTPQGIDLQPIFPATPTISPTITSTPYICPFQGQTDGETIVNLIEAEAAAVNDKDLDTIKNIFAPDAVIYDYVTPKEWSGPLARYRDDLFQTMDFRDVEHFDILPVGLGIDGDTAYYTSGSQGDYRKIGESSWTFFFNGSLTSTPRAEFGSDHWTLKKDNNGCWFIVRMDINAGHIPFP
jgi:ketosteroid isomerase-like protein